MTENKRFELVAFLDNVWGVYDTTEQIIDENSSFTWIWKEMVVDLLNNLYEENQSLKEFVDQLQEELVLFKKAGADMGNDLNAQISNLTHENQKQKREYRKLYDEMQDVYKSYRKELRKNTQLTGTIHRICAEHHINSKCYLEEKND